MMILKCSIRKDYFSLLMKVSRIFYYVCFEIVISIMRVIIGMVMRIFVFILRRVLR